MPILESFLLIARLTFVSVAFAYIYINLCAISSGNLQDRTLPVTCTGLLIQENTYLCAGDVRASN